MTSPHRVPVSLSDPSSRWYYACHWLLLIGLGLAIYYQTFQFDFVFDDKQFIVLNPYIRDFHRIHEMWGLLPKTRLVGIYSFALNYWINQLHPQGYHIFNFLVHLCAVALVWGVAGMLLRIAGDAKQPRDWFRREIPFIIAVVFLVHPCQTQAVTYISQRFESLATVFYLSAIYCYLHMRVTSSLRRKVFLFFLLGASAILGLMTKEVAVTIPLMILAMEWILWPKEKKPVWIYIAISAVGLFFCLFLMKLLHMDFRIFYTSISSESHDGDIIQGGNYFLTQMRVFLTFMRLLVFPINQNIDYDYPLSTDLWHPPLTFIGLCAISGIVVLIIRLRRSRPLIAVGLAWVLITFAINMVPRANVIFEHKLYLISFGFFLAVVAALSAFIRQRLSLMGLMIGVVIALSLLSFQRNQVWQNGLTLWEDAAQKSGKQRVYANLGNAYSVDKQETRAIPFFNKALAIKPDDYKTYMNRGTAYHQLGLEEQALEDFNKAIMINPRYFEVYIRRARVYKTQHNDAAEFADLTRAIELEPNYQYSYIDRSVWWMSKGRTDEALSDVQQALRIAPYDYGGLVDRAGIYIFTGHYDLAMKDLDLAQAVDPKGSAVYKNRAFCLSKMAQARAAHQSLQPK